jgi:methyltransferase-like protein/protein-L-isoaspartate O-methyltransferase
MDTTFPYDAVPYPSRAYRHAHPDRMALLARLFGLRPKDVEHCNVLEIGCGAGGHLLPMACTLTQSRFVGIDLAGRAIDHARDFADQLGLKNIEFVHEDFTCWDPGENKFDYIIAHGVLSWISPSVQHSLMALFSRCLAPHGIGLISYNTEPGWQYRSVARQMAMHHVSQFQDPAQRAEQAAAMLDFVVQARGPNDPWAALLARELSAMREFGPGYITHEYLSPDNRGWTITQFAQLLTEHGLQYLGDSEFHTMLPTDFPPWVTERLGAITQGLIGMEQYLDFLRLRSFRTSLVCRAGLPVVRELFGRQLMDLYLSSSASPSVPKEQALEDPEVKFTVSDRTVEALTPLTSAALLCLGEKFPDALMFDQLFLAARQRLHRDQPEPSVHPDALSAEAQELGKNLLRCFGAGVLELSLRAPDHTTTVGEYPEASRYARQQIACGDEDLTNLRGESVRLDSISRAFLKHLDGTRSRNDLVEALGQVMQSQGKLPRDAETDQPLSDPEALRADLQQRSERLLTLFAQLALIGLPRGRS